MSEWYFAYGSNLAIDQVVELARAQVTKVMIPLESLAWRTIAWSSTCEKAWRFLPTSCLEETASWECSIG